MGSKIELCKQYLRVFLFAFFKLYFCHQIEGLSEKVSNFFLKGSKLKRLTVMGR